MDNVCIHVKIGSQAMTKIVKFRVGDEIELKKPHPCGSSSFRVLRVGSEMRIVCVGCGRDMSIDRIKLEKSIKKILSVHTQGETV